MSAMATRLAALLLLAAPALPAPAAKPVPAASCDRTCLGKLADAFLDGLASRRQGADVPWADRVRYTENGVGMTIGDGIWATVTAHAPAPLVIADPVAQTIVWIGAIEEHGQPGWLALRIKASGGRIAEAEAVMRRKEGRPPFADPTGFAPDPAFAQAVARPLPRAQLVAAAQAFLDGRTKASPPRTRNGVAITGVTREIFRGLSFPAVDPAHGIVVAIGMRDHAGRADDPDGAFPHSYAMITVLKVDRGAAARVVEVSSDLLPYLMPAWKER